MRIPDFQLNVYLVPHGYQADILFDGDVITQSLRDFSDSHDIRELQKSLRMLSLEMLKTFKQNPLLET